MKRLLVFVSCIVVLGLGACKQGLTPEEQAQVKVLQGELQNIRDEIAKASNKQAGGLLKAYADLRLEVLKTSEALVFQRIQAIEGGAKVTVEVPSIAPDPARAAELEKELAQQEEKVKLANDKASGAGGLIAAMARVAAYTEENSLALLRQQHLSAKYGLAIPKFGAISTDAAALTASTGTAGGKADSPAAKDSLQSQILEVKILKKRFEDGDYKDAIWIDLEINPTGLDKPARAIKGILVLTDLFGEAKFKANWTLDQGIQPGKPFKELGSGFDYNRFKDEHNWVRGTALENMKAKYLVTAILYEDGETREF